MKYSKDHKINEKLTGMFSDEEEEERMKTVDLTLFLEKVFPNLTKQDGRILWDVLENKSLIVNGEEIAGTFRYNAGCISSLIPETDYMDFYCSWVHSPKEKEFIEKIEKAGGKIKDL